MRRASRAAFSAATSDPRAASGVLVARLCGVLPVRLRTRSCACPPRLGSPLSRDETLPGTGPLQRRSNAKGFTRRYTGSIPPPGHILGEETREGKGLVAHPGPIYNAAREKNTVSHHPVLGGVLAAG